MSEKGAAPDTDEKAGGDDDLDAQEHREDRDETAHEVDRGARRSTVLLWSVRIGLVAYGLAHLLFAWVAIRLVFTHSSSKATGKGALSQLADDTLGKILLILMAVAFLALLVWQAISALVGYRDRDGLQRYLLRFGALARGSVYGYLAVACTVLAIGGQDTGKSPDTMTAKVLNAPGGMYYIIGAGLVVAGVGIGEIVFGFTRRFLKNLDDEARNSDRRIPIALVGQVGYVVKGIAFITVGILFVWAAVTHDPKKSGGLDQALYRLLDNGLGGPAIVAVGIGVGCFGIYALMWSRHLDKESLTA